MAAKKGSKKTTKAAKKPGKGSAGRVAKKKGGKKKAGKRGAKKGATKRATRGGAKKKRASSPRPSTKKASPPPEMTAPSMGEEQPMATTTDESE